MIEKRAAVLSPVLTIKFCNPTTGGGRRKMLFSSVPFLFYFLPAVMVCYFIVPVQWKNAVLLIFSLLFYAWGEPGYVFLMMFSIVTSYVFGLLIEKYRDRRAGRFLLAAAIIIHVGVLGYFKYADFFILNLNTAAGLSVPLLRLALPIGISFYTFQILSYVIDVYRTVQYRLGV